PREGGALWPGAGSIVAAVQTGSGKVPISIGKPNTYMGERALEQLGLLPGEVLCVGDRLDTDILMGARSGMSTALLLTGVSQEADVAAAEARPSYIFEDLPKLMEALSTS
ncbi:MAG: HAD hydrolase-like protein, partial [Chloroflexota bacterium]|nr:HAD hydrolase-like protein [Chloroflexota bacterium]